MRTKRVIISIFFWLFFVLELSSVAYYVWIQLQQKSIIHNLERDLILDRNEDYAVIVMIGCGIFVSVLLGLLFTLKHKEVPQTEDSENIKEFERGIVGHNQVEMPLYAFREDPLRSMLSDDFCGLNDCIFLQLKRDLEEMKNREKHTPQKRFGEVAYKLYHPDQGPRRKLRKQEYEEPFSRWIVKFFNAIEVEPPADTHKNKYEDFKPLDAIPMKYLFVESFDELKDEVSVKKYLRQ